jgi:hypothetical protein
VPTVRGRRRQPGVPRALDRARAHAPGGRRLQGAGDRRRQHEVPRRRRPGRPDAADRPADRAGDDVRRLAPLRRRARRADPGGVPGHRDRPQRDLVRRQRGPVRPARVSRGRLRQPGARRQRQRPRGRRWPVRLRDLPRPRRLAARPGQARRLRQLRRDAGGGRVRPGVLPARQPRGGRDQDRVPLHARRLVVGRLGPRPGSLEGSALQLDGAAAARLQARLRARQPARPADGRGAHDRLARPRWPAAAGDHAGRRKRDRPHRPGRRGVDAAGGDPDGGRRGASCRYTPLTCSALLRMSKRRAARSRARSPVVAASSRSSR